MMGFLERVLRRPRLVLTAMALLLLAGAGAYVSLPKESFPSIDIPYFYVSVSQTGISPRDAERLLAKPIEDRLTGLTGLNNLSAVSTTGHVSVFLEFDVNTNKDVALADIRGKLDGVSGELPADASDATVTEISFDDFPILSVAVYGDVPERTLVTRAKELRDALKDIDDVHDVTISGSRDEMLVVRIDLARLEAYGLTAAQLFDAVAKNNLVVAGGTLDTGQGSFNVEVPGLITTAEEVFNLPLKTDGDTVVTFGDVATITRTFKDATQYSHVNGQPAITLGVTKNLGTNIIEVSEQVRQVTEEVTAAWPPGIQRSFLLDQSESTRTLYRSLEAAVLTAIALVMITCVAILGVRPALMIGASIPISFMIAFLVTQMLGMTINMMIMFGLVLAVGVLVDDPIVVVEYAERKLSEGISRRDAFIIAAKKMFVPVVSATATTLGAFVPLLFWPGIVGKFMSYLPTIVIVVMTASLLSALVFMPVIGSLIAHRRVDEKEKEAAEVVMYPDKFDTAKVRGLTGVYVRMMTRLIRRPIITLIFGFAIIGSVFYAYSLNPTGTEAFPASEPEYGTASVVARGNYSPAEILGFMEEVESRILQVDGLQDVIMTFGGGSGFGFGGGPPDTIGTLQLQLDPWENRVPAAQIFTDIRERVSDIPGLEVQLAEVENGPPAGKDINLRVESDTYEDLAPAVANLRNYIENDLGGAVDVEDGRPSPGIDWKITIDRASAAKFGIGVRELSPYVQLITSGVKIGTYRPSDASDELDIRVRLPKDERTFSALDSMRIATAGGLVPVSNFIERTAQPKVASITHRNGTYVMAVAANLEPGLLADDKVKQLKEWQNTQQWPEGLSIVYGGAEEQIGDANAFIVQAMMAAMFIIFLVLLLEYNSFWQVLVTLSTVIMSTAGVLLGMLITGMSFSAIMTGLGIVALAGIVVKNGIVLIDTYNHYTRDDGVEPIKAMLITISQRIRPVLLTASLTALGVIPMALNVEFDFIRREIVVGGLAGTWFVHLSSALVSGLFFSTALTLIMVPVMITAPTVIWQNIKSLWSGVAGLPAMAGTVISAPARALAWLVVRPQAEEGAPTAAIPAEVDSAGNYVKINGTGLVEVEEEDGVVVVTRQAAE